jgi:hypothetical protein
MSSIMEGLHRLQFSSDDYTQFAGKWKRVEELGQELNLVIAGVSRA